MNIERVLVNVGGPVAPGRVDNVAARDQRAHFAQQAHYFICAHKFPKKKTRKSKCDFRFHNSATKFFYAPFVESKKA